MILCGGLHKSLGDTLLCQFGDIYVSYFGFLYSCEVVSMDNSYDNLTIDRFTGDNPRIDDVRTVSSIRIIGFNINYIPKNLGFAGNLEFLSIDSSKLVKIKSENFFGMHELKGLRLKDNKLTSVPSDAFITLTKLRAIEISDNEIQEIPNNLFSNNLKLERIYLSNNKIEHIGSSVFKRIIHLREIYLNENQIEELPNNLFSDNVDLKKINFNNNKIKFISSTLFNGLTKLSEVHLKSNLCIDEGYEGWLIVRLSNDIKDKCFNQDEVLATTFPSTTPTPIDEFIPTLSNNFVHCKYSTNFFIEPDFTSCYTSFENPNDDMIITGKIRNYELVDTIQILDKNTYYIPANLGVWFNLTGLVLIRAQLIEIRSKDFNGMQDLHFLSLHDNNLNFLPKDVFSTLAKLESIDLRYNKITELPNGLFDNNKNLEIIYFNGNKIKYIDLELSHGLMKLRLVYLYENICVNKGYEGTIELIDLKNDIKINCTKPTPATTISTIITKLLTNGKSIESN